MNGWQILTFVLSFLAITLAGAKAHLLIDGKDAMPGLIAIAVWLCVALGLAFGGTAVVRLLQDERQIDFGIVGDDSVLVLTGVLFGLLAAAPMGVALGYIRRVFPDAPLLKPLRWLGSASRSTRKQAR